MKKFLSNLWKWKCGIQEEEQMNYDELRLTEWSNEFEKMMRNRLVLGSMRYGKLQPLSKPRYNRIKSMMYHIEKYVCTHNQEHLVDIANFAMCEFIEPTFDDIYFESIDDGVHSKKRGI